MWRSTLFRMTARSLSKGYSTTAGQAAKRTSTNSAQLLPQQLPTKMGGKLPSTLFPMVQARIRSSVVPCDEIIKKKCTSTGVPTLQVMPMQSVNEGYEPDGEDGGEGTLQASSTLKKRRLKMNKHKYRKRRKRDRRRNK